MTEVNPGRIPLPAYSLSRDMTPEHVDVLIVGAGISGVGAALSPAARAARTRASRSSRRATTIGGTWDLFRYPGIRSDSDMHTLGYRFKPWTDATVDRRRRRRSSTTCARPPTENGDRRRASASTTRSSRAAWSSDDARWTVEVERTDTGETVELTCGFLFMCSGYYRYDQGFTPEFPGIERFGGEVVHPQHWPEDLDYAGKRVVVIGSGATAVTLVPAMAENART